MNRYSPFPFSALLFMLLGLAGCATTVSKPSPEIQGLSPQAVLLAVPFESQSLNNLCGAASADMLTGYYGQKLSPAAEDGLRQKAQANNGISGADLKKALEEAGYFVAVFPGTLDRGESSLYVQLDQKRPLIAMIGGSPRHYVVVVGYDPDTSMIVLLDPARGRLIVSIEDFSRAWKAANNFTLLASPEPGDAQ